MCVRESERENQRREKFKTLYKNKLTLAGRQSRNRQRMFSKCDGGRYKNDTARFHRPFPAANLTTPTTSE